MTGVDRLFSMFNSMLEQHTQQYNNPLCGRRVLRSGGLNHINHHVHPTLAVRALVPPINESPWAALVVVSRELLLTTLTIISIGPILEQLAIEARPGVRQRRMINTSRT
jgi:hypothetical protein